MKVDTFAPYERSGSRKVDGGHCGRYGIEPRIARNDTKIRALIAIRGISGISAESISIAFIDFWWL